MKPTTQVVLETKKKIVNAKKHVEKENADMLKAKAILEVEKEKLRRSRESLVTSDYLDRNSKVEKPSPIIKDVMVKLYAKGFYVPYSSLKLIEQLLLWEGPVNQDFFAVAAILGIFRSPQTVRNEYTRLRKMGVIVVKGKLLIIEVKEDLAKELVKHIPHDILKYLKGH